MKFLSFLAATLFSTLLMSQSITGVATYKTLTDLPFKMDSTSASPDQQAMIQKLMAKELRKEYTLTFNRQESVFKEVEELEKEGGLRMGGFMSMFGGASGLIYKDLKNQQFAEQKEFFSKKFLIKDSLSQYQWQLGKETKSIGKYTCYKATATKVFERMTLSRNSEGETKDSTYSDTINLTAWYTMQIPISNGPDKYGGLPGLIMELNNGSTVMLCTKVVLNPTEPVEIEAPTEGEEVSLEEYSEITFEKIKQMQKMYKSRAGEGGGRGRGGSMTITIGG